MDAPKNKAVAGPLIARIAIFCVACSVVLGAGTPTVLAQGVSGSTALPNLGDGSDMTPSTERRLGDRIARELYRDPDYLDDPVTMEYVQGIWQPLLAAARLRGDLPPELDAAYAWEVLLGRDRTMNAFALPGAYLGLHLGLVGAVASRDELASVLAHELSHVTQRHVARMLTRQSGQAPWILGAMILGALAASKDTNAANAMIVGGQAVSAQTQLNFSRDMEREADRVGFGVMTQAGYAPQGFVSMFEKLQQAARLNDSGSYPYLRSHPLTTERMADMQARVPRSDAGAPAAVPEWDQAMVAARARVLSNSGVDALRTWSVDTQPAALARLTPAQQAGALYGATLAAIKLREFAGAQTLWGQLTERVRDNTAAARLARLLGAEMWLAQGNGSRALSLLQAANGKPAVPSRVELFLAAQAAVLANQPGPLTQSTQNLQTWVAEHPRDAMAWQLLANVDTAQGRTLGAIRAQAEVSAAQLDFPAALTRFKAAQDWARKGGAGSDYIEASIVDTRTRQMESVVREQALER